MKSLLPFLSWNYSALSPLHLLPTPLNLQTEHKIKTANNRIRSQRIFFGGENLPTFPVHILRKLKKGYKSFTNWANCEAGWIVLLIVISSYSPWNWHFRLYIRHPKSNFTFQPLIFRGLKRVTLNLHPKMLWCSSRPSLRWIIGLSHCGRSSQSIQTILDCLLIFQDFLERQKHADFEHVSWYNMKESNEGFSYVFLGFAKFPFNSFDLFMILHYVWPSKLLFLSRLKLNSWHFGKPQPTLFKNQSLFSGHTCMACRFPTENTTNAEIHNSQEIWDAPLHASHKGWHENILRLPKLPIPKSFNLP